MHVRGADGTQSGIDPRAAADRDAIQPSYVLENAALIFAPFLRLGAGLIVASEETFAGIQFAQQGISSTFSTVSLPDNRYLMLRLDSERGPFQQISFP